MSIVKNRYVQIFFAGVVAVFGFAYFTSDTTEETTASNTEEASVETTPVSNTETVESTNTDNQDAENTTPAEDGEMTRDNNENEATAN